ncbi:MAG: zf-HC2 domain-containing protein [Thiogranum sp.]|nr:zf-HC2 domain-containing protein [Thiogranum sp.]
MSEIKKIRCEEAISRLLEFLDRECDDHTHAEMDKHLSDCQACYSRMEFEQRLRSQLKKTGAQQVPGSLKGRIDKLFAGTVKK